MSINTVARILAQIKTMDMDKMKSNYSNNQKVNKKTDDKKTHQFGKNGQNKQSNDKSTENVSKHDSTETIEVTNPYVIENKTLGRGSFSIVKLAHNKTTKEPVAAKIVDLRQHPNEFKQEAIALSRINHPSVVKFMYSEVIQHKGIIYMEYLPHVTLESYLLERGKLGEVEALKIFEKIVSATLYLHRMNVSHHDMKSSNIAIDKDSLDIKIYDFGLSVILDPSAPMIENNGGSPLYAPPEVLHNRPHDPRKADCYSIGIILYEMLTGSLPFSHSESVQELVKTQLFERRVPLPDYLPQFAKELLPLMLDFNASHRISLQQVLKSVQEHFSQMRSASAPNSMTVKKNSSGIDVLIHPGSSHRRKKMKQSCTIL